MKINLMQYLPSLKLPKPNYLTHTTSLDQNRTEHNYISWSTLTMFHGDSAGSWWATGRQSYWHMGTTI